MKIKSKEELDKKVKELQEYFNISHDSNLAEIQNVFKDKFNQDILKIGDHATFYLNAVFNMAPETRKKFKGDPIQPITITYIRQDVIFFTWDKHSEYNEEYIMYGGDWSKFLYPAEIKLSELFKNKEYLKEKDYNEWYVQTHIMKFNSKFTNIIDDITYEDQLK